MSVPGLGRFDDHYTSESFLAAKGDHPDALVGECCTEAIADVYMALHAPYREVLPSAGSPFEQAVDAEDGSQGVPPDEGMQGVVASQAESNDGTDGAHAVSEGEELWQGFTQPSVDNFPDE